MSNGPTPLTRRLVSLLIVLHFLAILTAVTSASSANFPAPRLAVLANVPCQPYLQLTFLANAYRFYAPDPGAPSGFWFRIQYQDRSVRWLELPRRDDFTLTMPFERHLSLGVLLAQQVMPGPEGQLHVTPLGQIGLASYVRHLATQPRTSADGAALPVRSVGIYSVQHAAREPAQIRAGWQASDLRTYRGAFLGAYNAAGERTDAAPDTAREQPMAYIAAGIVAVDVWPLRDREAAVQQQVFNAMHLPRAIEHLLMRFPELRTPGVKQAELQGHIERLVEQGNPT